MGGLIGGVFVTYTVLLAGIVFIGYFKQRKKEKVNYTYCEKLDIQDLTVIVPFRNEAKRIGVLLNSINASVVLPSKFIFVDDHSNDTTVSIIHNNLFTERYKIIELDDSQYGKKQAIRAAMSQVDTKWVLSMDADVRFSTSYFNELAKLSATDAIILPVVMDSNSWFHRIYELDVLLINAVNAGINGWIRPIIASGANFAYSKQAFITYDRFEQHRHMPSGDDIYLLRDFREGGAQVNLTTDPAVAIVTETPQSFREFIHQRLRWIAKTGDVGDHLSTVLSFIQAFFTFFFFGVITFSIVYGDFNFALLIYALKSSIDLVVFLPYFRRMQRLKSWILIPVYELFFPLYSILILSLMYTYRPVWKGRKLSRNF